MAIDFEEKKKKDYSLRRAIMDYGMGVMIAGFGVFFAIAHKIGFEFNIEPLFRYLFAGLCLLYGGFRIYRGYKKNYYNE